MIREADIDNDGQINYDGAHPAFSSRPQPLNTVSVTRLFAIPEFVKVHTVRAFPVITCLLIVIDADDAGQVIAPIHAMKSRIGVSSSSLVLYELELTSATKVVDIMCILIM
jgi:hypothetical protein